MVVPICTYFSRYTSHALTQKAIRSFPYAHKTGQYLNTVSQGLLASHSSVMKPRCIGYSEAKEQLCPKQCSIDVATL